MVRKFLIVKSQRKGAKKPFLVVDASGKIVARQALPALDLRPVRRRRRKR